MAVLRFARCRAMTSLARARKYFSGHRADPLDSRLARDAFRFRLGAGRNFELQEAPSGHQYFTLKDQRAAIACVIFGTRSRPSDCARRRHAGAGLWQPHRLRSAWSIPTQRPDFAITRPRSVAGEIEALKRKLEAEGLFAPERKRPLPKFPRRIGIITSPSGAAIRDILNILQRRAPGVEVLISPVRVQGSARRWRLPPPSGS